MSTLTRLSLPFTALAERRMLHDGSKEGETLLQER